MNKQEKDFMIKALQRLFVEPMLETKEGLNTTEIAESALSLIEERIRLQKDLLNAPTLTDHFCPKCREGKYELYQSVTELQENFLDLTENMDGTYSTEVMDTEYIDEVNENYNIVCTNQACGFKGIVNIGFDLVD